MGIVDILKFYNFDIDRILIPHSYWVALHSFDVTAFGNKNSSWCLKSNDKNDGDETCNELHSYAHKHLMFCVYLAYIFTSIRFRRTQRSTSFCLQWVIWLVGVTECRTADAQIRSSLMHTCSTSSYGMYIYVSVYVCITIWGVCPILAQWGGHWTECNMQYGLEPTGPHMCATYRISTICVAVLPYCWRDICIDIIRMVRTYGYEYGSVNASAAQLSSSIILHKRKQYEVGTLCTHKTHTGTCTRTCGKHTHYRMHNGTAQHMYLR